MFIFNHTFKFNMIHSRHFAIMAYATLAGLAIAKGIISDINGIIAVLSPVAGMFVWDKLKGNNY